MGQRLTVASKLKPLGVGVAKASVKSAFTPLLNYSEKPVMYYVYVLQSQSKPDTFYLGATGDLKKRLQEHNAGQVSSTRGQTWNVAYYEAYHSKAYAFRREQSLKKSNRSRGQLMKRVKDSLGIADI